MGSVEGSLANFGVRGRVMVRGVFSISDELKSHLFLVHFSA